ncbi:MAG TPA: hypothetical protein VGF69_21675 [Thermoanaerobaculia bacterium]|jgi:hypothetical protein
MRVLLLLITLTLSLPAFAGYTAPDLYIPIAGRVAGHDGRQFLTTVSLTNPSGEPVTVTISFLRTAVANPAPRSLALQLAPNESRNVELDAQLLGTDTVGALRIQATGDVLAQANVYSRMAGETAARNVGATFNALPASAAIGTGESAIVQGLAGEGFRYRLYVVETVGHPLYFTATLLDVNGRTVAQKRFFVSPREQRTFEFTAEFPNVRAASLRLTGFNGSGKIVATGAQVTLESRETTPFEMSFPAAPRHRLQMTETLAYVAVGLSIVVAAVRR